MRVLLINKYHFMRDGGTRAYFDTAKILTERGHEVMFFSMKHAKNEPGLWNEYFVSEVDYQRTDLSLRAKVRGALKLIWNFEAQKNLEALIKKTKPDVAHLHVIYHQLSPAIIWTLKKHGIPIVMTLHDYKNVSPNYSLFVRGKIWNSSSGWLCLRDACVKNSYAKSIVCVIEQWFHTLIGSYRQVDAYIAPSLFLIRKFKELGSPLTIRQIAQPLLPFPGPPTASNVGKYYLFVGRLSEEKGVDFLLEAFQKSESTRPLIIIGAGPAEEALQNKASALELKNISFLGAKYGAELKSYIRGAGAVFVSSMWYENMPYTMLEAMGEGKVVIASRIGGIPERITHGRNGFLFEPGSTEDLVGAIHSFEALDPEKVKDIEAAAYESLSDLQPETYGQKLEDLYAELKKKDV